MYELSPTPRYGLNNRTFICKNHYSKENINVIFTRKKKDYNSK